MCVYVWECVYDFKCLGVCLVMDWQPVLGVFCLPPNDRWDRLQLPQRPRKISSLDRVCVCVCVCVCVSLSTVTTDTEAAVVNVTYSTKEEAKM